MLVFQIRMVEHFGSIGITFLQLINNNGIQLNLQTTLKLKNILGLVGLDLKLLEDVISLLDYQWFQKPIFKMLIRLVIVHLWQ